jgi:hypothetical protein
MHIYVWYLLFLNLHQTPRGGHGHIRHQTRGWGPHPNARFYDVTVGIAALALKNNSLANVAMQWALALGRVQKCGRNILALSAIWGLK